MYTLPERPGKGQWEQLCHFWREWWHLPDTQALRLIMATGISHFSMNQSPIWVMVVAPSSLGKSSLYLKMLDYFPNIHKLDQITSKAFVSGATGNPGLLMRMQPMPKDPKRTHGIISISDYSTILKMNPEERGNVESQLRTIYDQSFGREVGAATKGDLKWAGKVTLVGACTEKFDDEYATAGELGQRFTILRPRKDDNRKAHSAKAIKQIGHEKAIALEYSTRVKQFISGKLKSDKVPDISDGTIELLGALAELTANLRCLVDKTFNKREVKRTPAEEGTGRLVKMYTQLAIASARMRRATVIGETDIILARRLAEDSIPPERLAILRALPIDGTSKTINELREAMPNIVEYQIKEGLMDLAAMRVVHVEAEEELEDDFGKKVKLENNERMVRLTEKGESLLLDAFRSPSDPVLDHPNAPPRYAHS